MRDLFEAIAEYMSAEGADARREHAKKVRIEFDLVQDRMQGMQSRIEALEKDAARWKTVLHHVGADNYFGGAFYVIRGISAPVNVMRGAVSQHFEKSIDAAMQSEKGGV